VEFMSFCAVHTLEALSLGNPALQVNWLMADGVQDKDKLLSGIVSLEREGIKDQLTIRREVPKKAIMDDINCHRET
jgi:hypothetical protein